MNAFIFFTAQTELLRPAAKILGDPAITYALDTIAHVGVPNTLTFSQSFTEMFLNPALKARFSFKETGTTIVFSGPMPLLKTDTLKNCINKHKESKNDCTYMDGVYVFNSHILSRMCGELNLPENFEGAIEDEIISKFKDANCRVEYIDETDKNQFSIIASNEQLAAAVSIIKRRINQKHMSAGVCIVDPENTYIGRDVVIGEGTTIFPNTFLVGATVIGSDCIIGPCTRLTNTTLHNSVKAEFSVIIDSSVGSLTVVGPYAYIRPGSKIGQRCKIGDFVEIKNSVIADNSKASHLTYIGDSDVGEHVNFGCGTITVNYDGAKKARTTVEDNAFIGCNTNLVAPITVHEGAYVAAGSTITENVTKNSLAIARAKQINKLNWLQKRARKQND